MPRKNRLILVSLADLLTETHTISHHSCNWPILLTQIIANQFTFNPIFHRRPSAIERCTISCWCEIDCGRLINIQFVIRHDFGFSFLAAYKFDMCIILYTSVSLHFCVFISLGIIYFYHRFCIRFGWFFISKFEMPHNSNRRLLMSRLIKCSSEITSKNMNIWLTFCPKIEPHLNRIELLCVHSTIHTEREK